MIGVLYSSGLRCAEVLALRPVDVNVRRHTVEVRHGKGDKRRPVGINPGAEAEVERWRAVRRDLGLNRAGVPLFCTLRGGPIDPSYVRRLLPRLARRAGLDKRVHPHGLRHTFAAELANEGKPVHVIRRALGHSSLFVTARYIEHLVAQDVVDATREREWSPPE